jgi:hypothetical protein
MKNFLIAPFMVLLLVACGNNADKEKRTDTKPSTIEVDAPVTAAAEPATKYSAEAFFETTSFSSVPSPGFAYAPDTTLS